jgi:hypothetical protein
MSKKQATIYAGGGLAADPGDFDFVVDGEFADLAVTVFDITGTSVAFTATELFDDGFDLAYDAQTANFTPGAIARGMWSGATGLIVLDTDGGATGTLALKKVNGYFVDNEPLVDDNGTPGAAVVNGLPARRLAEGDVWATVAAISAAGSDVVSFINPELAATAGDRVRVIPRRFRLKATFVAITDVAYAVDLLQSNWGN